MKTMMNTSSLTAVVAVIFGMIFNLQGQSVWSGGAGNWSSDDTPGWNGTGVPNATDATGITSSATGHITVNGSYTLGTLEHKVVNVGSSALLSGGAATKLIFDVTEGQALLDGPIIPKGNSTTWSANMQLNDDLEIRTAITDPNFLYYNSVSFNMNGAISGDGGITLSNAVDAAVPAGASVVFTLSNTNNSFAGGIKVSPATALELKNTDSAGTGTIDFSGITTDLYSSFSFLRFNTTSQSHNNPIIVKKPGNGTQACWFIYSQGATTPTTVTLNGSITSVSPNYAARVRMSSGPGTLVLGGDNSGWGGELWFDPYDGGWGGTLIVDHLQALPDSVRFDCNLGNKTDVPARIAILFNVAGTFSEQLMLSGNIKYATINWPTLGTTDSLIGTVTLDNANAIYFRTQGQPLSLNVGNAGGTLELRSSLSDWVSGANGIYPGPVIKEGPGTAILAGPDNVWGGATTVSNGTLLVNSSTGWGAGSNAVVVVDGGTLGGTGVVRTAMTTIERGGTLAPGLSNDAIGTLTLTNLTLQANANYRCNTDNASSDCVRILNNATLPSAMTVTVTRADSSIMNGTRTILEVVDGTLSGDPAGWTVTAPTSGYTTELAPGGAAVLLRAPQRGTIIVVY